MSLQISCRCCTLLLLSQNIFWFFRSWVSGRYCLGLAGNSFIPFSTSGMLVRCFLLRLADSFEYQSGRLLKQAFIFLSSLWELSIVSSLNIPMDPRSFSCWQTCVSSKCSFTGTDIFKPLRQRTPIFSASKRHVSFSSWLWKLVPRNAWFFSFLDTYFQLLLIPSLVCVLPFYISIPFKSTSFCTVLATKERFWKVCRKLRIRRKLKRILLCEGTS